MVIFNSISKLYLLINILNLPIISFNIFFITKKDNYNEELPPRSQQWTTSDQATIASSAGGLAGAIKFPR